ncbi:hypothetical protein AVEN_39078-1 [Araneus ventricosus]|uniref:Uncharacterized protein n=1 Tax=Araneus ventricosus TaxID=182803 RepID=A0A4Y2DER2_ARAVE|nr:hypothetical protein AVEN_39078-1 [Araneus ventricosus]
MKCRTVELKQNLASLGQQGHIHGGSSVESGFEPGACSSKAETLPLGHRGPWGRDGLVICRFWAGNDSFPVSGVRSRWPSGMTT